MYSLLRSFNYSLRHLLFVFYSLISILLFLPDSLSRLFTFLRWRRSRFAKTSTLNLIVNSPDLDFTQVDLKSESLCVNQFVLTDLFIALKPRFYMLLDPKYALESGDSSFIRTVPALDSETKWPMILFVPTTLSDSIKNRIKNPLIKICAYHINAFDAHTLPPKIRQYCYANALLAPPASNVLVHALYISLHLGFKSVLLHGASLSYFRDLSVDASGHALVDSSHFYGSEAEHYSLGMSGFFLELYQSFLSLEDLYRVSLVKKISILNMTSHSFIDSLPRS